MFSTVYVNNDNVIEAVVLNSKTGLPINDATVVFTVQDSTGANLTGQTWPTTMEYVPASDGVYRGTLKATTNLVHADKYTATIDITTIEGPVAQKVCRLKAAINDCDTASPSAA